MRAGLKRRIIILESGNVGAILQGFIQLDEAGDLFGIATYYDEPDPELTLWLKTFTPKLETLALTLMTVLPNSNRTHEHTVRASDLHPEVKPIIEPYLSPGSECFFVDGKEGWPLG